MADKSKEAAKVQQEVQEYYGKVLTGTKDLKSNACCTPASLPKNIRSALAGIHEEVIARYYGCGLTIPSAVEGLTVLDLGSGAGRDCFLVSKLVGEKGKVIGVDMTKEQLEVAQKYVPYHTAAYGYAKPNVTFLEGDIQALPAEIASNSVDLIISNCVVNLVPNKEAVLREAYRVLKDGGEMYFSDVYADRRIPPTLAKDKVLWGECLSGALYLNDFLSLAKKVGFTDPRLVEHHTITINNPAIEQQVGSIAFTSATFRLFKVAGLEPQCEDYGQSATYLGTVPDSPSSFSLDASHTFPVSVEVPVCGNTFLMLARSRLSRHFSLRGDTSVHRGAFPCATSPAASAPFSRPSSMSGSCCGGAKPASADACSESSCGVGCGLPSSANKAAGNTGGGCCSSGSCC